MLICIDEKREVIWHNEEISKEESTKYLSENVFWFDIMPIPETPPLLQNETVELYLSAENILYYKKIEKVLPVPEPTEIETLTKKVDMLGKIILGGGLK